MNKEQILYLIITVVLGFMFIGIMAYAFFSVIKIENETTTITSIEKSEESVSIDLINDSDSEDVRVEMNDTIYICRMAKINITDNTENTATNSTIVNCILFNSDMNIYDKGLYKITYHTGKSSHNMNGYLYIQ